MSQQASRMVPVNVGTSARILNVPLLDPDLGNPGAGKPAPQRARPRTPLSLVTSTPRRGRSQLVGIFFTVIVVALSVVLVMSISVSKGQYELVGLKNHQADLLKANQTLEQEIAAKAAPQDLVAQAVALGMVPAGTAGQIDIRTKTVSGSPQPASPDTKGLVIIPPALVDKPHESAPVDEAPPEPLSPAAAQTDAAAAGAAASATTGNGAKDDGTTGNGTTGNGTTDSAAGDKAQVAAPPATVAPELNGGTIPAPAQKDG